MVILLALTLKHGLLMGKKIVKGPPPPGYPVNHLGKIKTIVQAVLSPLCIQNDPNTQRCPWLRAAVEQWGKLD